MMYTVICAFAISAIHGAKVARPVAEIKATLLEMAPDPGILSGTLAVYRFARYRVDAVCSGHFLEKEIVVGHLVPLEPLIERTEPGGLVILSISKASRALTSPSVATTTTLSRRTDVRWIAQTASAIEKKTCQMAK